MSNQNLAYGVDISKAGVYQITNTANSNKYVGSSVNIWVRWKTHTSRLRKGEHHNKHLQRAWSMYGESSFILTPLMLCERHELKRYEQGVLNILKPEYNMTTDVEAPMRGVKFSKEHREKIAKALMGNVSRRGQTNSPEHKEKIGKALEGKRFNEERCKNIGISKRGNTYRRGTVNTPEHRRKISEALKGRTLSDKHKANIGAAQKGIENSGRFQKGDKRNLGRKHTEETKKKMSDAVNLYYAKKRGEI